MAVIIWLKEVLKPQMPNVVGLWWDENLDPLNLSAPRGVILPEELERFETLEVEDIPDDEELLEGMPDCTIVDTSIVFTETKNSF
jgi:hypothetical protein